MKLPLSFFALGVMVTAHTAASAESTANMSVDFEDRSGGSSRSNSGKELPPYLQCVPFARALSGIQIYGDALSWWDQADGRYQRGHRPQVGAVMAFQPYRNMTLGHVAAVSSVIDNRTVLISHSNWSPINGRRGQIERNVRAVDVSPNNDWSMVRVWYHPLQAIGGTAWPVQGFIYSDKAEGSANRALAETRIAGLGQSPGQSQAAVSKPAMKSIPSGKFSQAFADLGAPTTAKAVTQPAKLAQRSAIRPDPVRDAIARYEK